MALTIDETPARPGEWGFRPENTTTEETPPAFVWRPQENAASYDIQCAQVADFSKIAYEAQGLTYTVHRTAEVFESGQLCLAGHLWMLFYLIMVFFSYHKYCRCQ